MLIMVRNSHIFSFLPHSPMPSWIINVKDKCSHGSLSISRSQIEVLPPHPRHMSNYLKPKLTLVYLFFILLTPLNCDLHFLNIYWWNYNGKLRRLKKQMLCIYNRKSISMYNKIQTKITELSFGATPTP